MKRGTSLSQYAVDHWAYYSFVMSILDDDGRCVHEGGDFVVTNGRYVPGTGDGLLACVRGLLFEARTQKCIQWC